MSQNNEPEYAIRETEKNILTIQNYFVNRPAKHTY